MLKQFLTSKTHDERKLYTIHTEFMPSLYRIIKLTRSQSLARSFYYTSQLVNKNRTRALSMTYSLFKHPSRNVKVRFSNQKKIMPLLAVFPPTIIPLAVVSNPTIMPLLVVSPHTIMSLLVESPPPTMPLLVVAPTTNAPPRSIPSHYNVPSRRIPSPHNAPPRSNPSH